MSGSFESSVTLDDVFVVVGAKRVPLAPELAGYLALEIAEGAAQAAGDVDPRSVYIGEEGSVALVVRPRRDAPTNGDAEASVRAILAKLLDASGSQTPALGGVARRRGAAGGLPGLVEELEAALIPVNRAAGRRALARLAREVKRVTLGVGRNASLSPSEPAPRRPSSSSSSYTAVREPAPPVRVQEAPQPARVQEPPPPVRVQEPPQVAPEPPPAPRAPDVAPRLQSQEQTKPLPLAQTRLGVEGAPKTVSAPDASELPTIEVRKEQLAAAFAPRANPPPPVAEARAEPRKPSNVDEVDHLLASFAVSQEGDQAARNQLKALVGLEPTPPPPGSEHGYDEPAHEPAHSPHASDIESLLNLSDGGPPVASNAESAPMSPPQRPLASPPTAISPQLANEPYAGDVATVASAQHPPASLREPRPSRESFSDGPRAVPTAPSARKLADLSSFRPPRAPGTDRTLSVFALAVLGAGAAAIYVLKPAFFSGRTTPPPPPTSTVSAASASAATAQAARCHASIVVTGAPDGAEVLLRVGQAPVDVEHMPVGAPLEFVATAEGFAPKRVVIPAGATWDTGTDGKPRYEAAVQLDRSRARTGSVDSWPPAEAGSEAGGKGSPGTVHLVATPRGAEMWMLIGLGSDARVDQLKCGGDVDMLIAGPTTLRKRLHVAESSFVALDGGTDMQATVSAK